MRTLLFSLFIFAYAGASAQSTSYTFRFRYEDYSIFSNQKCVINGQMLATDPQGIVKLPLSNSAFITDVQSADVKQYRIRFPVDGHVLLPKNPSVLVDIFIAKPGNDLRTEAAAQTRAMTDISRRLDEQTTRMYKAVTALLTQKTVKRADLNKGRMEYLPLISQALNQYLVEVRNFNNAFYRMTLSLTSRKLSDDLAGEIHSYNDVYEVLNANRNTYEQAIATYWGSKELSLKFSNLMGFALDDVHRQTIYETNFTYIRRINELKTMSKKDVARQKDALTKGISDQSALIGRKITELESRISEMNTLLGNFNASAN
ncbi:MAG: hypothetical protein INR69_08250 [Mucilaginibacter polytrichastri]|nr:hypothetical protein [Mucilaginibacter polytrichastri]